MPLERVFALGSQELLLTSRGPAKKMVALIGALDASEDLVKSKWHDATSSFTPRCQRQAFNK